MGNRLHALLCKCSHPLEAEQSDAISVDSADDALLLLEAMLSTKSADVSVGDS